MSVLNAYLRNLVLWTSALGLFFLLLGGAGPGTQNVGLLNKLPAVLGFALALGTFPAGVAVSCILRRPSAADPTPIEPTGVAWRSIGILAATALGLSLLMYLNTTSWAPNALAASEFSDSANLPVPETHQTSAQLRTAAARAYAEAEATGIGGVDNWRSVNTMAWELERRLAHTTLPFLLTWIGVFSGYWTRRIRRSDLRLATHWALGLFLVVSLYLAGENSFELIVLRAGGPVFFSAWFIAFVPAALFGTLGWVTALQLLGTDPSDP